MRKPITAHLPTALLVALVLAGCATAPSPDAPAGPDLPAAWGPSSPAQMQDGWQAFGDARLNALIDEALKANADVARSLARVAEARAQAGVTDADRGPQLGLQAGATRSRGSVATGAAPAGAPVSTRLTAGLQASYELDLWGRLAQASSAARADWRASEADLASVRLTVASEVARQYIALVSLDAQRTLTRDTLVQQREALGLQRRRAEAGVISDFELRQLEGEIANLEASLPDLDLQRERTQSALLVLLGRSPRAVFVDTLVSGTPALPPMAGLPSTLPSELLLRRPDLVRAQQRLAAAQARVEVARKAGWPSVNLAAGVGTEGARLSDLFSGPAFVWSLGASAAQTLFDSGRREAATDAARARQQQAVADWEAALAQAFREVRDALSAQAAGEASARAQGERVAAQERVLALARLRFTNGVASQLDVLDAQRALQAARSALVAAEQARRNARIDLYKALGGGWAGLPPS